MTENRTKFFKPFTSRIGRFFWSSETAVLVSFAVIVGLGTGLGTVLFIEMIKFFNQLFFGTLENFSLVTSPWVILLPMIGGLPVGFIVEYIAKEAKGHGVPEVLTAIATRGGRIRPVVVVAKALGSAITIGSGGSVGREGPIVQIGAALGSVIGQFFKLSERRVVNLVASGAAAGIAATFNAPIAGVLFSVEVILGDFGFQSLGTVVISAVTASVVSRAILGDFPAFVVPAYSLNSPWELILYLGLGVLAGFAAWLFVKLLYFAEDVFDAWKFPNYLKPAVGGLGLGILGFFVPQVFGTGFTAISDSLAGKIGLGLLLLLIVGKIVATSLTLGAGASGGVFAPALFTGAMLGGAYGTIANMLFPGVVASSGAYAMVGMAAVFAGAARAPVTAILILFEMTQDYHIVLPLMFATVISTLIAQWLEPESIYTLKLARRGLDVKARRSMNLMSSILVDDAMTPVDEMTTVSPEIPLPQLAQIFQETSHHGLIVFNEQKELYGIVTISDLERALKLDDTEVTVADICTTNVLTVFPDETLNEALRHFGALDVGRIPVVSRHDPMHVIGVLRRTDIVHAYSNALVDKQKTDAHMSRLRMQNQVGTELKEFIVSPADVGCNQQLKDFSLPDECVIVSIQRGSQMIVPRGRTRLTAGDKVFILTKIDRYAAVQKVLREGNPPETPKE